MTYILKKLAEPSTYAGLLGIAGLLGFSELDFTEVTTAIAGVASTILIFINEAKSKE